MIFRVFIISLFLLCCLLPGISLAQDKVVVVPLAGDASVSNFEWVTQRTTQDSTVSKGLIVECPAGKVAIGGGVRITGTVSTQAITVNGPLKEIVARVVGLERYKCLDIVFLCPRYLK